jgi:multiple sugar transport system ATP-binding protein
MDEPLSNHDAKLRVQTRAEIARLHHRLKATMIYVTHDQIEAMTMADRIAVMNGGLLEQIGSPRELYESPANRFVAGFIGSPAMNFLQLDVANGARDAGRLRLVGSGTEVLLDDRQEATLRKQGLQSVLLGVRPEHLAVTRAGERGLHIDAMVDVVEFLGNGTLIHAAAADRDLVATVGARERLDVGDQVMLSAEPPMLHLFDPQTGAAL